MTPFPDAVFKPRFLRSEPEQKLRPEKNWKQADSRMVKGYALTKADDGDELRFEPDFSVRYVSASPRVRSVRGLSAVTRGKFVMCMEGIDNGGDPTGVKLKKARKKLNSTKSRSFPF